MNEQFLTFLRLELEEIGISGADTSIEKDGQFRGGKLNPGDW